MESNNVYGNKSLNLMALKTVGVNIPPSYFLNHSNCAEINSFYNEFHDFKKVVAHLEEKDFFNFETSLSYPMIVRSSSADEDGHATTNAGKYLSIYNAKSRIALVENIIKCWNSKVANGQMGLVIQNQLSPYYSGVAFINGSTHGISLIVEAVIGLGELLVSGYVTPNSYMSNPGENGFSPSQVSKQYLSQFLCDETITLCPTDDIFIKDQKFRILNYNKQLLYASLYDDIDYFNDIEIVLNMLKTECEKICSEFGDSDIEWVYTEAGELFIVQRRPITVMIHDDQTCSEYGGKTIVSGIRTGKLTHLSNYNGQKDAIVFDASFNPKDMMGLLECSGIISSECSLLSHTSILAREMQLPYWAGLNIELIRKFENKKVEINFAMKTIKLASDSAKNEYQENASQERSLSDIKDIDVINDFLTLEIISPDYSKPQVSENLLQYALNYFDGYLLNLFYKGDYNENPNFKLYEKSREL